MFNIPAIKNAGILLAAWYVESEGTVEQGVAASTQRAFADLHTLRDVPQLQQALDPGDGVAQSGTGELVCGKTYLSFGNIISHHEIGGRWPVFSSFVQTSLRSFFHSTSVSLLRRYMTPRSSHTDHRRGNWTEGRLWSTDHATASATTSVSQNKSRIEKRSRMGCFSDVCELNESRLWRRLLGGPDQIPFPKRIARSRGLAAD